MSGASFQSHESDLSEKTSAPNRIVLVGSSTPVVKVLSRVGQFPGVQLLAIFTDNPPAGEITRQAEQIQLKVRDVEELKGDRGADVLREFEPDWLFNVNSTFIFPTSLLETPKHGCLNLHPGRLPDYAGLHTHQWAIRNGESTFGSTLHWMTPAVDAGEVAYTSSFPLAAEDTGLSVLMKCLNTGADLVVEALTDIAEGRTPPRRSQDLTARRVYLDREARDGKIDWTWTAQRIANLVRAADYRPFTCPTYSPTASVSGQPIIIRQIALADCERGGAAGEVVDLRDDGPIVVVGDGNCLQLRAVESVGETSESKSAKKLRGQAITTHLGIQVGDRLE